MGNPDAEAVSCMWGEAVPRTPGAQCRCVSGLGASYAPSLSPLQLAGPAQGKAQPSMSSSSLLGESSLEPPVLLSDIKTEPPEELLATDCNQPQAEPVDLSLHKAKGSLQPPTIRSASMPAAPPAPVVSMPPAGLGSSAIPAVLSPGSILASTQGSGGQQILHVIHTIPSVNLPSKMGNLQTIPVVVQSLPVVYTTMPSDGVTAAITVPLIGGDGKNAGSGELCLPSCHLPQDWEGWASASLLLPAMGASLFWPHGCDPSELEGSFSGPSEGFSSLPPSLIMLERGGLQGWRSPLDVGL